MQFKRIEILVHVIFWVLVTWFIVSKARIVDSIEIIDGKKQIVYIKSYERMLVFFLAQVFFLSFFYIELYLISRLKKPKAIRGFILKSFFLFITTPILYLLLVQKVLFPNNEISDNLNALASTIIYYLALVILYGFTKKWITQERDNKQLELVKNQAELNLLRNQLQPHFLFNTLNNIMAMVNQRENPLLARSIDKLSGLLRYVVYDTKNEKVAVAKEIEFIRNFAELHTLRFEENEVDFKIDVVGNFKTQVIEPGILLCYVENAFKHALQPEEKAFIYITIDISSPDKVKFKIENSIPKIPWEKKDGGYGLKSNQERLHLAYPNKHRIQFTEGNTYDVTLILETND